MLKIGTPLYMSDEVNDKREIDAREWTIFSIKMV